MRIKAKNSRDTHEYYVEPYTVQHFVDSCWEMLTAIPRFVWFVLRYYTSKAFRIGLERQYNRAMFGNIPTSQIYVSDSATGKVRPLREEERTWPE